MAPAVKSTSRRDFLRQISGDSGEPGAFVDIRPREPAPAPSLEAHVANRLMYGPRPGDVAAIETLGVSTWLTQQLNPGASDNPELTTALNALPNETLSESVTQLYDRRYMEYADARRPVDQVRHATIARMLYSRWQLREMMVEFWHNHFNVYAYEAPIMSLFPDWDRLLRDNVFGNFRTLLEATAKHPVMLHYLDNYLSTNAGPNENYARELFELHTLGAMNYNIPDGYSDSDVYESSRCFTGWTYERGREAAERGKFRYVNENHDRFQKRVLDVQFPQDQPPLRDGLQVLDLICDHPGTARHIVTKLCKRFVSENPPESLVDSATTVFYQNRTNARQIAITLRHIFDSEEFRDPANMMTLFKRPFDWIISTMRGLSVPYVYIQGESSFEMTYMMNELGHTMFGWRSPDGPPNSFASWATANSLLKRYNFILRIDARWWENRGLVFPAAEIMPAELRTTRQIVEWWVNRVMQRPISATTYDGLLVFVAEGRNYDLALPQAQIDDKVSRIAALCTITPEFMWR